MAIKDITRKKSSSNSDKLRHCRVRGWWYQMPLSMIGVGEVTYYRRRKNTVTWRSFN